MKLDKIIDAILYAGMAILAALAAYQIMIKNVQAAEASIHFAIFLALLSILTKMPPTKH